MKLRTKLSRNGNSWYIRLPRSVLQTSGLKPNSEILLIANSGRITIYSASAVKKLAGKDGYQTAKQDARQAWDEAFEQVWLEIFGTNE